MLYYIFLIITKSNTSVYRWKINPKTIKYLGQKNDDFCCSAFVWMDGLILICMHCVLILINQQKKKTCRSCTLLVSKDVKRLDIAFNALGIHQHLFRVKWPRPCLRFFTQTVRICLDYNYKFLFLDAFGLHFYSFVGGSFFVASMNYAIQMCDRMVLVKRWK